MTCPVSERPFYVAFVDCVTRPLWGAAYRGADLEDAFIFGGQANASGNSDRFFIIEARASEAYNIGKDGLPNDEAARLLADPFTRTFGPYQMVNGERVEIDARAAA